MRVDLLPESYVPDKPTMESEGIYAGKEKIMVGERTKWKNRISAELG